MPGVGAGEAGVAEWQAGDVGADEREAGGLDQGALQHGDRPVEAEHLGELAGGGEALAGEAGAAAEVDERAATRGGQPLADLGQLRGVVDAAAAGDGDEEGPPQALVDAGERARVHEPRAEAAQAAASGLRGVVVVAGGLEVAMIEEVEEAGLGAVDPVAARALEAGDRSPLVAGVEVAEAGRARELAGGYGRGDGRRGGRRHGRLRAGSRQGRGVAV